MCGMQQNEQMKEQKRNQSSQIATKNKFATLTV